MSERTPKAERDQGVARAEAAATAAKPCLIVGIGASAGGQEALEHIFTALPADCGLAVVVVMHLPPGGPSFLAEMLGRYTPMPVVTAEEEMALQPDTVHVIPAGRELTLSGGRLRLEAPAAGQSPFHPIDLFFRSLAAEAGERSLAVVLSGYGQDGAAGVQAVREAGGVVIVQAPDSAINPAMPRSAIATGAADLIVPAEELAEKIAGVARGTCPLPDRACRTATLEEDLAAIFAIVKARTGHDFSSYKRNTVVRRIERRMAVNDVAGLQKYIALLEVDEQEPHALGQEILIGVTSFFRDPEAFEVVRRDIIPRLFAHRPPEEPVRIWHACCATGEEVYSTAILIREYLQEQRLEARVQLFATDLDEAAIAQARAGLYFDDIEADVGEQRLQAFFTRVDGRWQVAKQLREMVVFAHHNLIKDPPFSRLDLLVCRNFLIYLNPDMQKRLISLFHLALRPHGCLFLGASETVGRASDLFAPLDKKWKIFERLEGGRREDAFFPVTAPARRLVRSGLPPRPAAASETAPGQIAGKLLAERYSPPFVVVNEKYEVAHVSPRASRFLEVPAGEPTRDLLKQAREELRPPLRAAIYKAFSERKQVALRGVKVPSIGEATAVNILVEPLEAPASAERLAMVVLEPALPPAAQPAVAGGEVDKEMLVNQLEEQLRLTHEQLQAVTEQLETSHEGFLSANEELMSTNEEFQSANEELQSTNEELETSKEELQALNEELGTVNAELQGKVEELDQARSDLENLFRSSEIATIFLDRQLTIRRFSPAMASIFNLIAADLGRPFRHLAGTIDWAGLPEDARTVLASLVPVEREVAALEGKRHFLMRVLPYRTTEGRVDGVAVTLVDITAHKRAEKQIRSAALFPEENPFPVLRVAGDGNLRFANRAAAELLAQWECAVGGAVPEFVRREAAAALASGTNRELELRCGERDLSFMLVPIAERGYVNLYGRDITEHKRAVEALQESESFYRQTLDSIPGMVFTTRPDGYCDYQSQQWVDYTGVPMSEHVGDGWNRLLHPEDQPRALEAWRAAVEDRATYDLEYRVRRHDGIYEWFKVVGRPIRDEAGRIVRWFGVALNIEQLKGAEEALQESELRVRRKLESVLSPEGDLGALELVDLIDAPALQSLMDDFYPLSLIPMAILDVRGQVLVGAGWQDICTQFHRVQPDTSRHCLESDTQLSGGLAQGECRLYKCRNNMWDMATPIMVAGQHVGNIFTGQFFFEDETVDREFFRAQARKYGFDEDAYLAALDRVPRLSRETVERGMAFFLKLADTLSRLGHSNVKLARLLAERDRLTDSLRESAERLKRAQEISHLGSWELDLVHNVLTWSDEVYRIFGLQPQEFGATYEAFLEAVHPADRSAVSEAYSGSIREGRGSYEIEHRVVRKATGEIRHVHEKCEHLRDETGRIIRSVGMVHDITERKQAEESLHSSYERIALLNDTASRLLASDSPQSVVEDLCRKVMTFLDCQAFFNFLVDEPAGRLHLNACAGIPPEEAKKIEWLDYGVAVCGCAARDGCRIVVEDIRNTPDPRIELVKSYGIQAYACHPLIAQGRVLGTLSFGTRSRTRFAADELALMKSVADLVSIAMERKRVEDALQRAHDELELRVRERTAELREKDQLLLQQSRQAAMGEMINNIAHQWRQPLNALGLIIQSLAVMRETGAIDRDYLAATEDSAMQIIHHMSQTIDDFRNYFKPDKEKVAFSLNQPILRTVHLIEESFGKLNIAIDVAAAEDPVIEGYPNEFAQVLLNILINARDAFCERQVRAPKISIAIGRENGKAVVTVADNAGGIPESIMEKIFEPYFTTKGPDQGTGIGLFMSKTIIEKNMGGRLIARNTGDGAEFRIEV